MLYKHKSYTRFSTKTRTRTSQKNTTTKVRDLSESAKDDPEFMADLAELEQTLLANQRLPPLSFEERVRSKFVKAARYAFCLLYLYKSANADTEGASLCWCTQV